VVKIGSQTIVDNSGALKLTWLSDLIRQIAVLKQLGFEIVLVSSGAVASGFGLTSTHKPLSCNSEVAKRQILASLGQAKLIETYNGLLLKHGLLASQILLTKQDFKTKEHYHNITLLFLELLAQNHILPIVNENDTVAITELMFTDNDELAGLVATLVRAEALVILTNVAGIYDRNPNDSDAQVIRLIDARKNKWPKITALKSELGRGGMQSKLATAKRMAKVGIRTHIASASEPNCLIRMLDQAENLGTIIKA
jgi:glutamate 5-kinase